MIKTGAYLKGLYNATAAMGDPIISSDAFMEIEGFEQNGVLIKQFPWPELSPMGEIEQPLPMGSMRRLPAQLGTAQQGPITFVETQAGHIKAMFDELNANGARFNAKVYEGTPDDFIRVESLRDCFVQLDPPDRDWENRQQILLVTGTIFYNYFGNQ